MLASSVKTLPAHPTPPCLAKGGQALFYMMLISQNSSEGSLLTLHTGLSNVQKLTNVKKDSFKKIYYVIQQKLRKSFTIFAP